MKTIINSNVERIIEDEMLAKYKALGYKEISSSKANDNAPENKPLSKMKVDELKALATELGIENTDSLTRDELIAVKKRKMDKLKEQFKKLAGETDEELVSSFLLKSQNTVLSKTNRSELIDDLNDYVLKLAIALYNRQGNEGLASYSEGGVNLI